MYRSFLASMTVVLSVAGLAEAKIWDNVSVDYPSTNYHVSPEYTSAIGGYAGCDTCGTSACSSCGCGHHGKLFGHFGHRSRVCCKSSHGCCADLWSGYCNESCGFKSRCHTRYHWFANAGCQKGCGHKSGCCASFPMCSCNGHRKHHFHKACSSCYGCMKHHVRGFWNKCKGSMYGGCDSCGIGCGCGSTTEMYDLDQPEMYEEQHPHPTPVPAVEDDAKEARLILPSLKSILPVK